MTAKPRLRRWSKITVGLILGLILFFHIGGGYFFSNMIRADALTPQAPSADNGIFITAVAEEAITISSLEERSDSTHPGVFGLSWKGGYGRIGEIIEVDGRSVTRSFELVDGDTPQPCTGPLENCAEVDIEGWTYPTDPADAGGEFEEVKYETPLGEMGAWRIDSGDGSVWAIHVHGWRASRREAIRTLPTFEGAGITSLVIDYRNDPGAPADPTGLYRFGLSEWEDVEAAVRYAAIHGAEEIVLVGYSTGASAHMAFLENSELAGVVNAVVFDSPNIDMGETIRVAAARMTIPGTPIPVPATLTSTAMLISDLRWDVDWDRINYLERSAETLIMPTLVFHGLEDPRVPIEVSRALQATASDAVRLVEIAEAGHVTSWNVDPTVYEATLRRFLAEATG